MHIFIHTCCPSQIIFQVFENLSQFSHFALEYNSIVLNGVLQDDRHLLVTGTIPTKRFIWGDNVCLYGIVKGDRKEQLQSWDGDDFFAALLACYPIREKHSPQGRVLQWVNLGRIWNIHSPWVYCLIRNDDWQHPIASKKSPEFTLTDEYPHTHTYRIVAFKLGEKKNIIASALYVQSTGVTESAIQSGRAFSDASAVSITHPLGLVSIPLDSSFVLKTNLERLKHDDRIVPMTVITSKQVMLSMYVYFRARRFHIINCNSMHFLATFDSSTPIGLSFDEETYHIIQENADGDPTCWNLYSAYNSTFALCPCVYSETILCESSMRPYLFSKNAYTINAMKENPSDDSEDEEDRAKKVLDTEDSDNEMDTEDSITLDTIHKEIQRQKQHHKPQEVAMMATFKPEKSDAKADSDKEEDIEEHSDEMIIPKAEESDGEDDSDEESSDEEQDDDEVLGDDELLDEDEKEELFIRNLPKNDFPSGSFNVSACEAKECGEYRVRVTLNFTKSPKKTFGKNVTLYPVFLHIGTGENEEGDIIWHITIKRFEDPIFRFSKQRKQITFEAPTEFAFAFFDSKEDICSKPCMITQSEIRPFTEKDNTYGFLNTLGKEYTGKKHTYSIVSRRMISGEDTMVVSCVPCPPLGLYLLSNDGFSVYSMQGYQVKIGECEKNVVQNAVMIPVPLYSAKSIQIRFSPILKQEDETFVDDRLAKIQLKPEDKTDTGMRVPKLEWGYELNAVECEI